MEKVDFYKFQQREQKKNSKEIQHRPVAERGYAAALPQKRVCCGSAAEPTAQQNSVANYDARDNESSCR